MYISYIGIVRDKKIPSLIDGIFLLDFKFSTTKNKKMWKILKNIYTKI